MASSIAKRFAEIVVFFIIIAFSLLVFFRYYDPHSIDRYESRIWQGEPEKEKNQVDYALLYPVNESELAAEVAALTIVPPPSGNAQGVVVLNYHGTVAPNAVDEYSISTDEFKQHLYALKQAGYQTITLRELEAFLQGTASVRNKSFVLTFDDGLKDTYYHVDPLLKVLNYTAAMFVITGQSFKNESKYYLTIPELHAMETSGRWELGSHSHEGHGRIVIDAMNTTGIFLSNKQWLALEGRLETNEEYEERVRADSALSKELLEREFNYTVKGFALPFGNFGQRESNYADADAVLLRVLRSYYTLVFYQFKPAYNKDFRANYPEPTSDFHLVMRIPADSLGSSEVLLQHLSAAEPQSLPYEESFSNPYQWVPLWGGFTPSVRSFLVTRTDDARSAAAYLDGSYLWTDYTYGLTVGSSEADKLFLLVRFTDAGNYAGCRFTSQSADVIQVQHDVRETYTSTRLALPVQTPVRYETAVEGTRIVCRVNGFPVATAVVPTLPPRGGVGIRVEDLAAPSGAVVFYNITAEGRQV